MKLLTLNTHSLEEENYEQKLQWFLDTIVREKPDIIALQEVNQTCDEAILEPEHLEGQYPVPGCIQIRRDNHAATVARGLRQRGIRCWWSWIPIKRGYGKYDEGIAVLSLGRPIRCVDVFPVSKSCDYNNWRTRAALGVQVEGLEDWFYCLHMGWWDDELERFLDQWKTLNCCIASKRMCGNVWLMGDFNAPDSVHGQSYEHIVASGWFDTYVLAHSKDKGITAPGTIDGWKQRSVSRQEEGLRLDYIWSSRKREILSSRILFNGVKEPMVSDHFGILIDTKES